LQIAYNKEYFLKVKLHERRGFHQNIWGRQEGEIGKERPPNLVFDDKR
jgi:hypothetical protein